MTQEDLVRRLVDALPAMIAYWDADCRCRFANRAYETWFGVKAEDIVGRHIRELLGPIYPLNLPYIEGALRGERQSFQRASTAPGGGPLRYGQVEFIPDAVDGVVRGFFVLVTDVTYRQQLEEDLRASKALAEAMATHDALTGLANRLLLTDRFDVALRQAERGKHGCAVLFIDMDGFKVINDTLGHAAGDEVLKAVATRIEGVIRKSDTAARFGGDEFIVLLPEVANAEQAEVVARKLLAAMSVTPFRAGGKEVAARFSIGIALYPEHGTTSDALLVRADAALYQAKAAGRDRYIVYEP